MRMQKRKDAPRTSALARKFSPALLLLIVAGHAPDALSAVPATTDTRISVTAVAGDVDVTMAGNAVSVRPASTVVLPARVVTGHDGTLGLTQAGTNISVANDTDLEIPAEAVDGNLVARLIQHRGNVFYDVAPRDVGKLRVETPLLVAVIKGTQFNVAVQQDSTTISLFEGQLEIRTPDTGDIVQLNAGEIAIRSRGDGAIRVVGMDDERVAAPRAAGPLARNAADAGTVAGGLEPVNDLRLVQSGRSAGDTSVTAKPSVDMSDARVVLVTAVEVSSVQAAASIEVAAGAVDVDTRIDVGGASAGVALDAGVDVGSGSVDVGLGTTVDLGVSAVEVGVGAGVDLGGAALDASVDVGLDLGGSTADVGLDTGLDLDAGTVDVDAGLDLGGAVDVALDVGVDADSGSLDLGLDLGDPLDLGLDVDLAAGLVDLSVEEDTTAPAPPPPPRTLLGGLLGGL